MPGPRGGGGFGGGSRGGGGFGGGGHRGGFHGGGYHHHHYHRPFFGGWFFGPRFYGGGCLGFILAPFIALAFIAIFLFLILGITITNISNGGTVVYNEHDFQDYANDRYYELFDPSSETFEDNIMIIFLTNEEHDGYYCIAWIGNNVTDEVAYKFSSDGSVLENSMIRNVPDVHEYSLSANLATVVRDLTAASKNLPSFYENNGQHTSEKSKLVNHSSLNIATAGIDTALSEFTAETDIPLAIVVDDMEEVFGKGLTGFDIAVIVTVIVATIVIVVIIYKKRKKNKGDGNSNGNNGRNNYNGYNNDGSGYYENHRF